METAELDAPATVRAATTADAEPMGSVAVRSWEATYRGMLPDAVPGELTNLVDDRPAAAEA